LLFAALLSADPELLETVTVELADIFGGIFRETAPSPWTHTDYYSRELGEGLLRKFVFFSRPVHQAFLVDAKFATMSIERKHSRFEGGRLLRRVNVDPGYMDRARVVLASGKDFSHRIRLGRGIHAEVTLFFREGCFRPLGHTYPDYREERTIAIFNEVRNAYFSSTT